MECRRSCSERSQHPRRRAIRTGELDERAAHHYIRAMFTGLVATTGILTSRVPRGPGARLGITGALGEEPLAVGESVAVDGVCLTVVTTLADLFEVDVTAETLSRTTLGGVAIGHSLNLERALRAGDRLGGHLVTGHVDAVGTLAKRQAVGESVEMSFAMPRTLAAFVAEKGSIAINGVSMTVNAVGRETFDVAVIPNTQQTTNLGRLILGNRVNLEVDLIARYVARAVSVAV
jgi:riboflavin synthase